MSSRNPTDWMWAQACDMIDQAERMHRRYFRLAAPAQARTTWEPPIDVFEDEAEVVIIVALPGVPADSVAVTTELGDLVVRAEGRLPFAGPRRMVRRLEIPYGYFERRIRLPEARVDAATREMQNGCLILRLRKTGRTEGL